MRALHVFHVLVVAGFKRVCGDLEFFVVVMLLWHAGFQGIRSALAYGAL